MAKKLSKSAGPAVDISNLSHLSAWQDAVALRPHGTAVISYHQKAQDFHWLEQQSPGGHLQWSFIDLDRNARRLATALNRQIPKQRRPIAVLLNNQVEWLLSFWAAAYLHCPIAPINPKSATRKDEISHMLRSIQPSIIVTADSAIASLIEQSLDYDKLLLSALRIALDQSVLGTSLQWQTLQDVMSGDSTPPDTPTDPEPLEDAVILFTSGTTSLPKPCAISSAVTTNAALAYVKPRNITSENIYISQLPNFHSYGVGWILAFLFTGSAVILPAANFEPQATLTCIERFEATHMSLVPTTTQAIIAHPALQQTNIKSLKFVDISGAGILPSVVADCKKYLNVIALTSYGMTESPTTLVFPIDGASPIRDGEVYSGMPSQGAVVKICKPESRDILPVSVSGELHTGGVHVIKSYMNGSVSSDKLYTDEDGDNWIVTGDQAVMDEDGAVRICGRYKDLIIRGGENISPASIEAFLQSIDGIHIAQVVGVPDEMAGEVPVAIIQTSDPTHALASELKNMAASTLGTAFAPKWIFSLQQDLDLESFPTTAAGKIRKIELREIVQRHLKTLQPAVDTSSSSIEQVVSIWQQISGADNLRPETTIQSFADSLMMMQLSSKVKQIMSRDITVEDFKDCDTIQDQVNLIDSRAEVREMQVSTREGPPKVEDVVHINEYEAFVEMRSVIRLALETAHLRWDDVEDIVPLPDWDAIFAKRTRAQSWNLRYTYHADVDCIRLQSAFRKMLHNHPALRSIVVQTDHELPVMVTMHANEHWFSNAMTTGHVVEEKEDLDKLLLHDPAFDSAVIGGPMFRVHIAQVRNDNTSGVVIVGSHAVCDMTMTKLWMDDVAALLADQAITPHVPFKQYADAYHSHRYGSEADAGLKYWTQKLVGIGNVPEKALWPEQRAPEFFKGNDFGWERWDGQKARAGERNTAITEKDLAQRGLKRVVPTIDIAKLKSEHNVPIFMLVKAAIALMNHKRTSAKEAVFGTLNAARTWPFKADYTSDEIEKYTGNPLNISGCTTEYVLDRVSFDPSQTLVTFMQQVTSEEESNSKFAKTPILRIIDSLRSPLSEGDLRSWLERDRDADAVLSLIRRQSFNWLPTAPSAQSSDRGLKMLTLLTRMDNGLTIGGFLADDKKSVVLTFTWDAEHLTREEAAGALADLAVLVESMAQASNWNKSVEELLNMT